MGFRTLDKANESVAGFKDPALEPIREQAHDAKIARRKTLVVRLPLPEGAAVGDIPFWAAAIQQVEQHGFELHQWSVCPEPAPVAYAVFRAG